MSKVVFLPIINPIQKLALYESKRDNENFFILVGSNNTQTRFRILKIDRTEPTELKIYDDKVEYSKEKIYRLIASIDAGNRQRSMSVTSAFGILGFVRFLEGYYMILITKRRKVAVVGHHTIYKIEDTNMIYIPNDATRALHQDETRYEKMFKIIDLSSNFYFSYSYDLTNTLQNNMSTPSRISPNVNFNEDTQIDEITSPLILPNMSSSTNMFKETQYYGIRAKPNRKFIWNNHLLKPIETTLHPDWILYVTHGFVGQSNISVFGRSLYVTLIARRSNKFAGTRYLKRGANFDGDVANEVETEQMVHDSGISSLNQGRFCSFVQMRGSIPGHWSQDISKMVPKPAISIDLYDPFAETAGAHFNELFKRYGSPVVILNLVKKREKKKRETFLTEEMIGAIEYLNQFLPPEHLIKYIPFDMARKNKSKEANVMGRLANIANKAVMETGMFQNQDTYYSQNQNTVIGKPLLNKGRLQTGIIRTNCVDCLDRTNTAQFAIGKCALGFQLCALGILDSPKLEFDTDCVRMLEELYEDHGDTLALQYGGSQLVHRIKTYRKTAPWTSQGNDIMQTLSRFYSNTFSDAEKQNAINLFLGLFIPEENKPQIWEYLSDYHLHFKPSIKYMKPFRKPLTEWWDENVLENLPRAYNEITKTCSEMISVQNKDIDMVDAYVDYHKPDDLTFFNEMFAYQISNSVRDFMPNFTVNFSPFSVRVRPGKRREEATNKGSVMKNPSLTGQSSTGSMNSNTSSSEEEDSSEEELSSIQYESQGSYAKDNISSSITFESIFPQMKKVYGTNIEKPKKQDISIYRKYVLIGKRATIQSKNSLYSRNIKISQQSSFKEDSVYSVTPPNVSLNSVDIYAKYIEVGSQGGSIPSEANLKIYHKYLNNTCKKLNSLNL